MDSHRSDRKAIRPASLKIHRIAQFFGRFRLCLRPSRRSNLCRIPRAPKRPRANNMGGRRTAIGFAPKLPRCASPQGRDRQKSGLRSHCADALARSVATEAWSASRTETDDDCHQVPIAASLPEEIAPPPRCSLLRRLALSWTGLCELAAGADALQEEGGERTRLRGRNARLDAE